MNINVKISILSLILIILLFFCCEVKNLSEVYPKLNIQKYDTIQSKIEKDSISNLVLWDDEYYKKIIIKNYKVFLEHESNINFKHFLLTISFDGQVYLGDFKKELLINNVRVCNDKDNYTHEYRGMTFCLYDTLNKNKYIFGVHHNFNFLQDSVFYIRLLDNGEYEFKFKEDDSYHRAEEF